jgi:hypothetical protein
VDISPEAQNTQGTIHKPHETQKKKKKKKKKKRKSKVWILPSFLEEGTKYPWKELQSVEQ